MRQNETHKQVQITVVHRNPILTLMYMHSRRPRHILQCISMLEKKPIKGDELVNVKSPKDMTRIEGT